MNEEIKLVKSFNSYMMGVKCSIAAAIKNSELSRGQIADKINELISGQDEGEANITVSQIDSWTKTDGKRTAGLKYLPVFCYVLQDFTPLQELMAANGLRVVGSREVGLIELGKSELHRLEAQRERNKALKDLGWKEIEE